MSSYQVFARKYRPQTFDQLVGQEHVVRTLRNAIAQNRLAHAYLFVGPRGVGKTTTARILAKALNCPGGPKADFDPNDETCREIAEGRSLDVLEIDGASNNGVDQVRDLRDNARFAPARAPYKIYIIDEVHMLSTAAFNALLKTLEEPPPHVKFIFATTEAHKVLPTILSRCQRFDLGRIPTPLIAGHLASIAANEGVALSTPAAFAIAKGADGGLRDAESMLDQLVAFCGSEITEQDVFSIFGFTSAESIASFAGEIIAQATPEALRTLAAYAEAGKDLMKLLADLIGHLRGLLLLKISPENPPDEFSPELLDVMARQSAALPTEALLSLIDHLAEAENRMKWASGKKLHFEIALIKAIHSLAQTPLSEVLALLGDLAEGRVPSAPPVPRAPAPIIRPEGVGHATVPPPRPAAPAQTSATPLPSPAPAPEPRPAPKIPSEPKPTPVAKSEPTTPPEPRPTPVPKSEPTIPPEPRPTPAAKSEPTIPTEPKPTPAAPLPPIISPNPELEPETPAPAEDTLTMSLFGDMDFGAPAPPKPPAKPTPKAKAKTKPEPEPEPAPAPAVAEKKTPEPSAPAPEPEPEPAAPPVHHLETEPEPSSDPEENFPPAPDQLPDELAAALEEEYHAATPAPSVREPSPVAPDLAAAWSEIVREATSAAGNFSFKSIVTACVLLESANGSVTLGLPTAQSIIRDRLKNSPAHTRLLQGLLLRHLRLDSEPKLNFVLRDDLPVSTAPLPSPTPERTSAEPQGTRNAPPSASSAVPERTPEEILAEFRSDPLIQRALEIFQAEILK